MDRIVTCLWFEGQAEEAAKFYASVFRDAKVGRVTKTPASTPHVTEGKVLTVEFEINGQQFVGLNGGKQNFAFNESISFQILCADQVEIDEYWDKLVGDGGRAVACSWCQDKYGVFWQIAPTRLLELIYGEDRGRAARAFQAMQDMVKIDLAAIEAA